MIWQFHLILLFSNHRLLVFLHPQHFSLQRFSYAKEAKGDVTQGHSSDLVLVPKVKIAKATGVSGDNFQYNQAPTIAGEMGLAVLLCDLIIPGRNIWNFHSCVSISHNSCQRC